MNGNSEIIEEIRHHLTLGNYAILKEKKDSGIEVAMLLKIILSDFTQPVCPIRVFEEFIFPNINELMNIGTNEDKMKFVTELLVSKIGFDDKNN